MKGLRIALILSTAAWCSFLPTGAAVAHNTPAQDLAEARFHACDHFATIQLDRIETSGRVMVTGAEYEAGPFMECMSNMARTQGATLSVNPVVVTQIEGAASS